MQSFSCSYFLCVIFMLSFPLELDGRIGYLIPSVDTPCRSLAVPESRQGWLYGAQSAASAPTVNRCDVIEYTPEKKAILEQHILQSEGSRERNFNQFVWLFAHRMTLAVDPVPRLSALTPTACREVTRSRPFRRPFAAGFGGSRRHP